MTTDSNINRIIHLLKSNQLDESLNEILNLKIISNPIYENLHGVILAKKSLNEEAKIQFNKTIQFYPDFPDAYYNLATILLNEKSYKESEDLLKKAIKLRENYYEAMFNLGNVLRLTNQNSQAINFYLECKKLRSDDYELYNVLALSYLNQKKYDLSIQYLNQAISLRPDSYKIYNNLALAHHEIGDNETAIRILDQAININPSFAEAYLSAGNVYRDLKDFEKANSKYEIALNLDKKLYQAYFGLAKLKIDLKKDFFGGINDLNKAISLNPNYDLAHNLLATCYLQIFDHDKAIFHFEKSIEKNNSDNFNSCLFSYIFHINYFLNYSAHKYFSLTKILNDNYEFNVSSEDTFKYKSNNKIKIGFFSGDFCNHAVAYQIIDLIKLLSIDENFEIYGFYNKLKEDKISIEFKKYFKKWFNLFLLPDLDIVSLVRNENLDLAFDLSGYTGGSLLKIFRHRIAKHQVTWCGYLNSTGINNLDFILGDKFVFSNKEDVIFSEKKLIINNCWTNLRVSSNINITSEVPVRKNGFITFGCFNNLAKINDPLLESWSKILLSVDNSILYLKNVNFKNLDYKNFLINKFDKLGIKKHRLILEKDSSRDELLNCYNQVDIALDTYPYNGGTTTLEAYSMCVPVLTLVGENFISRCGYSVNSNLGLEEWSCFTYDEYIEKGISFAKNIKLLEQVRKHLIENRKKTPVFNSELFTKDFKDTIKMVVN
jgi:predicted O-linked N-acetylglucosamine transferase (SPINDLY family)